MNCPAEALLHAHAHGHLAEAEAEGVELHVRECGRCYDRLNEFRARNSEALTLRRANPLEERHTAADSLGNAMLRPGVQPRGEVGGAPRTTDQGLALASARARGSADWPIPDYERILLCGEGSYGSVWAVRDRAGVYRALKLIDLERLGRARAAQRERSAVETYCRKISRHPYLVSIHHLGQVGSLLYYTMELADDRNTPGMIREEFPPGYQALTLETIIQGKRLYVDVAMEIARRLLRGLSKLHSLDLVHRDIKPSNVIFVNRQPKLADIGLISAETESSTKVGTPRYMPPDRRMDKSGDTYSFGKVLYEMIVGRIPGCFPAIPVDQSWKSTRWDRDRVNELLVRACGNEAASRFPNASALLEELEACADLTFEYAPGGISGLHIDPGRRSSRLEILRALAGEIRKAPRERRITGLSDAAAIAIACIRTLPWILGFVAVVVALWRLTG